jgi:hypothetical protein
MFIAKHSLQRVTPVAIMLMCLACYPAAGQVIDGVSIDFLSPDPIIETVGTEVHFELVARDTLGNVLTDWDTRGHAVSLSVLNSIAAVDTNIRSCYSWDGGKAAVRISPFQYSVDRSVFVNGRAAGVFQDSKAEAGIAIEVTPFVPGLTQRSPLMTFTEGDLENYMLELTGAPYPESDTVYVQRLYELLVRPQDRYCNTITREEKTMFTARFPSEFDARQGNAGDLFGGTPLIAGDQRFLLLSRTVREEGEQAQWIQALSMLNFAASGKTRDYYILPHSPNPFSVTDLPDSTEINLAATPDSTMLFSWERPSPPDPYTNCYQSVLDTARYSDELRYTVFFFDAPTPERSIAIDSDGGGLENQLTRTVTQLRTILTNLYPKGASNYARVLWRVEATDGLTITTSNPSELSQLPFYRLFFLDTETDASTAPRPSVLTLHQNYPNPFNPSTTITFSLPRMMSVSLIITDMQGREASRLVDKTDMEAGTHSLPFDADGIPSGVYTYRLETEDAVLVRTMVVMK